jgi:cytochrome c oxidase subunit 4
MPQIFHPSTNTFSRLSISIAVIKMLLVALFFMHVLYSTKLTKVVVVGGLFWLGLQIFLTLSDFLTRGWLSFPGK